MVVVYLGIGRYLGMRMGAKRDPPPMFLRKQKSTHDCHSHTPHQSTNTLRAMSGPKPIPSFGKVLVVGGCGFLGSHVVSLILKRHPESQVAVLDLRTSSNRNASPSVSYHEGDITDAGAMQSLFAKIKPDVVFHTASPHFDAPPKVLAKVNVEGTENLLKAAQDSGVKAFVYTSSASLVIDASMMVVNADETWPLVTGPAQPEYYTTTKVRRNYTTCLVLELTKSGFRGDCGLKSQPNARKLPHMRHPTLRHFWRG